MVASAPATPARSPEDFCRWQEIPRIERLAGRSRVPAVAAALMATPRVRFYHNHVLVKEAGHAASPRPAAPRYPALTTTSSGRRNVSAWIPVDPVPLARHAAPGAGRPGHASAPGYTPRTFRDRQATLVPRRHASPRLPPDVEADPQSFDIRRFELRPGDAIFFDFLTVHI